MRLLQLELLLAATILLSNVVTSFVLPTTTTGSPWTIGIQLPIQKPNHQHHHHRNQQQQQQKQPNVFLGGCHSRRTPPPLVPMTTTTRLFVLLDVPDGFFTVTLFTAGILIQLGKGFGRFRMEERAWEQRLQEARQRQQQQATTTATTSGGTILTELDLRRQQAAQDWSAYGKPRMEQEERRKQMQQQQQQQQQQQKQQAKWNDDDNDDDDDKGRRRRRGRSQRVTVREDANDIDSDSRMSDEEIRSFELEYGIDYDPYYDEPYSEDELPQVGKYQVDKRYGDRIYDNGEIFYKDTNTGLYYRQGSKPRNPTWW